MDGDISWKAALAWISLKLKSNWKAHADTAGQTESCNTSRTLQAYPNLATHLPKTHHRTDTSRHARTADTQIASGDLSVVSQALPETCPTRKPEIQQEWVGGKVIKTDGEYWYSYNYQYRCHRESGEVERRQRGGTWKRVSDFHKYQEMPQAILRDFERVIEAKRLVESAVFS